MADEREHKGRSEPAPPEEQAEAPDGTPRPEGQDDDKRASPLQKRLDGLRRN